MKQAIHDNYIKVIDDKRVGFKTRAEFIGIVGCKACKRRCKGCHMPFSVSTATDENNYCSSGCEADFFRRL